MQESIHLGFLSYMHACRASTGTPFPSLPLSAAYHPLPTCFTLCYVLRNNNKNLPQNQDPALLTRALCHSLQIIHNPGCMPARALLELTDLCVVFEDTWTVFLQRVADGVFDDDYHERQAQLLLQQEQEQEQEQSDEVTPADAAADDVPPADATATPTGDDTAAGLLPEEAPQGQDPPQLPTPPPEKQVPVLPDRRKRAVVVHSVPLPAIVSLLSETEKMEGGELSGIDTVTGNATDTEVNGAATGVQGELEVGKGSVNDSRAAKVKEVIDAARRVAGTVFVTELHEGYYESFGPGWGEWAGGFNGVGREVDA